MPLSKLINWYFKKDALPYWGVLLLDCAIVGFSGLAIMAIRYSATVGFSSYLSDFWGIVLGLLICGIIFVASFRLLHTYSGVLRYSSFVDLQRVAASLFIAALISCLISVVAGEWLSANTMIKLPDWRSWIPIWLASTLLMWIERVAVKTLYDIFRVDKFTQRTLIYGVKEGGVSLAKDIRNQEPVVYKLCGFITPDNYLANLWLMGVEVYPDDDKLLEIIKEKQIQTILVSPLQSQHFRERQELIDFLVKNNIHIQMLPESEEWDGKSDPGTDIKQNQLHEVDIEDLLPRDAIEVDLKAIGALLKDKVVMITGAAGSIGYQMVRTVAKFGPKNLVLIDQAETPMHTVRLHMANHYAGIACETIVSSISNQTKMEAIFAQYHPDYVFHAAAYKHVPMMEDNPSEAVQNNIYGTRVIADLAVKYGTKKFVMISTDKAVNPTNVMGCSKRICEIYCQALNKAIVEGTAPKQASGEPAVTQFITTRFGNVLGSNGSVIPIFKKQIAQGGPITVTHPDIIRFFMLIPEACKLVLEAGTMGHGGEIFVFDMGKPVRIVDLAQRMIDLSGAKNVKIEFTGLRDGEKLYEEVLSDKENTKPTVHPKIMVAQVREYDYALAQKNEEELLKLSYSYDDMAIVAKMKEIVPEYRSQHSKYQALDKK